MKVAVGEVAPEFTLLDQHGEPWSLAAHRGRPVVLYFYPKDDTPGCTNQACDVRDHWTAYRDRGAVVAGISPDAVDRHSRFAAKHDLPHTLLADPTREVIETYGAWGERQRQGRTSEGVLRSSVVIDADGKVAAVADPIKPAEQSTWALDVLGRLAPA